MRQAHIHELEQQATEVAGMLRTLGSDKRLMILCKLAEAGEMNVTELAKAIGLGQSALSQHLARLRADDLLATRRDNQTIWYRIANDKVEQLMVSLHAIFCTVSN